MLTDFFATSRNGLFYYGFERLSGFLLGRIEC